MKRIAAVLLVAAGAVPAVAQPVCRPAVYAVTGYGRVGFHYGYVGDGFALSAYRTRTFVTVAPLCGPFAFDPWGGSDLSPWPQVVVAPPVVRRPDPTFDPAERFPPEAERMEADGHAKARIDAAVKRGEFLVVAPRKNDAAVLPLPPPVPVKPPPVPLAVRLAPPTDRKELAAWNAARAREAFAAGELGTATERFRSAIAATPDASQPHFLLAQVRIARGEFAEALASVRDGMALNPDWPLSRFDPADLYAGDAARFAADRRELDAALAAHPDDPTLQLLSGIDRWFAGERRGATALFEKATAKVQDDGVIDRFRRAAER